MKTIRITMSLFAAMLICSSTFAQIPILNGYDSPLPTVVTPGLVSPDGGVSAPSDAISLFNGKDLSEWTSKKGSPDWTAQNGVFTVKEGAEDIFTKKEFSDFQLHIEWMHPADITGEGQIELFKD